MNLTHCTLTGVDARSDLNTLRDLSRDFPKAEWGFLYSPSSQGQPGRYPSVEFLRKTFAKLVYWPEVRVALHICGRGVADLLQMEPTVSLLVQHVEEHGGRVQLNFNARAVAIGKLRYSRERASSAGDNARLASC